jgi:hypothetical protein
MKNKKEEFSRKLLSHIESGNMSITEGEWLMEESDRLMKKLNSLEKEENDPSLEWDKKEQIESEQFKILKSLLEISRRMQIEQKRLLDNFQEDINLMNELEDIDKT